MKSPQTDAQTNAQMNIGVLAQRTGVAVSAIRYYEEVGLIPPAVRRPSGHRVYSLEAQELLALIRQCRDFGFSIDETRALVSLSTANDRGCAEAREIAQVHLDKVRAKLVELKNLERSLSTFVQACTDQCIGGPAPKCSIFQDIKLNDAKSETPARCCG